MSENVVLDAVIAGVVEVQNLSGRSCPRLGLTSKPIGDVEGFDSLMALEATICIEEQLGWKLTNGNPFISVDGTQALNLADVAIRVAEMRAA